MITITGTIAEVAAIERLILLGRDTARGVVIPAGSPVLQAVRETIVTESSHAVNDDTATVSMSIETQADRDAANREFVLSLPGRHAGTVDRWKVGSSYGYTTQHNGLGQAVGGRDLIIFHEDVAGVGYGKQPLVSTKITYQRVSGPKGLQAKMVCMIDDPTSVFAFIKALKEEKAVHDAKTRRQPPPPIQAAQQYQRAKPGESSFKGKVAFHPDPASSCVRGMTDITEDEFSPPNGG